MFTADREVNAMLDLVKQETERVDSRFLDPACGDGNFMAEILYRKLEAIDKIPNEFEKQSIIAVASIYGIDIMLDNVKRCRDRLYNIWNDEYVNIYKAEANGNIIDEVKSILNRNITCGDFFDIEMEAEFDVIISNPPYHLLTGGGKKNKKSATQAKPIYHKFIEKSKLINPRYICMIIPARWYSGGIGLNQFRNNMLNDKHIIKLVDYANSKDCFHDVDIAGGVCYFLWDRDYQSDRCEITNISGDSITISLRTLNEFDTLFVRSNDAIQIINKIKNKSKSFMDKIVSPIDTFGIPSKEKGDGIKNNKGDIALIHTVGYNKQGVGFITRDKIKKNHHLIDKYKVKISIMVPQGGEVGIKPENGYRSISTPQVLLPGQVDSFSYLNIGFFDSKEEAENLAAYVSCKLIRFLLRTTYSSAHISRNNFKFVPVMNFKKKWTDQELYEYFELSKTDIELIEKTMRPIKI